jgi:hypothetical protein
MIDYSLQGNFVQSGCPNIKFIICVISECTIRNGQIRVKVTVQLDQDWDKRVSVPKVQKSQSIQDTLATIISTDFSDCGSSVGTLHFKRYQRKKDKAGSELMFGC